MRNKTWMFALATATLAVALAAWAGYQAGASSNGAVTLHRTSVWSPGPAGRAAYPLSHAATLPPSPLPADLQPGDEPPSPQPQAPNDYTITLGDLPLIAAPPTLIDPNVSLIPSSDELWPSLPGYDSFVDQPPHVRVAYTGVQPATPAVDDESTEREGESPAPPAKDVVPSETASTILEMRKKLGSVLDRTVFAPADDADAAAERREIIKHILDFEEQNAAPDESQSPPHELSARCSCAPCRCQPCRCGAEAVEGSSADGSAPHVHAEKTQARVVRNLRDVGAELDQLANDLERVNLFDQADHLRGVAQQLREDARAATRGQCPCQHSREPMMDEFEEVTEAPEIEAPRPSY